MLVNQYSNVVIELGHIINLRIETGQKVDPFLNIHKRDNNCLENSCFFIIFQKIACHHDTALLSTLEDS